MYLLDEPGKAVTSELAGMIKAAEDDHGAQHGTHLVPGLTLVEIMLHHVRHVAHGNDVYFAADLILENMLKDVAHMVSLSPVSRDTIDARVKVGGHVDGALPGQGHPVSEGHAALAAGPPV